ncbi:MAG: hypothetical protein ACF8QF_13510 [Phycisphaerales bacterium]
MACPKCTTAPVRTVKPVAPEDLAPGMYVTALAAVAQCWPDTDCVPEGSTLRALRMSFTPVDAGVPLKVESVCLPFVLASEFDGRGRVLDVRSLRLARVRKKHAKAVFAAFEKNRSMDKAEGRSPGDSTC